MDRLSPARKAGIMWPLHDALLPRVRCCLWVCTCVSQTLGIVCNVLVSLCHDCFVSLLTEVTVSASI